MFSRDFKRILRFPSALERIYPTLHKPGVRGSIPFRDANFLTTIVEARHFLRIPRRAAKPCFDLREQPSSACPAPASIFMEGGAA